jgi:hypothetical protein
MMSPWSCSDWIAIHDHMPGHSPITLRVEGNCTFPTMGWAVKLVRGNPGINPKPDTLYLGLEVAEPSDQQARVITTELVQFEEETDTEFHWVEVNHGEVARIEVQHPQ